MIASLMMVALGASIAGLLALAIGYAWVRRTERVTERRLLARVAIGRDEFAVERAGERARAAIALRRLEQQADDARDIATRERAVAARKGREALDLSDTLTARVADIKRLEAQLQQTSAAKAETERRLADSDGALRAAHSSLEGEIKRRAALQEALEETSAQIDRRADEVAMLRGETDSLRALVRTLRRSLAEAVDGQTPPPDPIVDDRPLAAASGGPAPRPAAAAPRSGDLREAQVIALPRRASPAATPTLTLVEPTASAGEGTIETEHVEEVAKRLQRISHHGPDAARTDAADALPARPRSAESRFIAALEEIRTLKRTNATPGE